MVVTTIDLSITLCVVISEFMIIGYLKNRFRV